METMKMIAAVLIILMSIIVNAQGYNMFEPDTLMGLWMTKSEETLTFAKVDNKYLWMNLLETKRGDFKFDGKTFIMRLYVGRTLQGWQAETIIYGDCTFSPNGAVLTVIGKGKFAGKRWVFKRVYFGDK